MYKKKLALRAVLSVLPWCAALLMAGALVPAHAQSQGSGSTVAADSKTSRADARWMQRLARLHAAQIEAGKLAIAQGQRDEVRALGKTMVEAHTQAQTDLNTLATQKRVLLTNQPDGAHHKVLVRLATLSGDAFDREFVRLPGIRDHTNMAKLLQEGVDRSKDAQVNAYAAQALPVEKRHFQAVRDISVTMAERTPQKK